jgi:hypothetical protein
MRRIDVRSARGDVLQSVSAEGFDPVRKGISRTEYPILGHIDPYGDTVFNRMQVRTLMEEIARLECADIISGQLRDSIIELCERCLARPHQFLWFIGE